jgi:hypothetical protein
VRGIGEMKSRLEALEKQLQGLQERLDG